MNTHNNRWTPEEDNILKIAYKDGLKPKDITKLLPGHPIGSIKSRACSLKFTERVKLNWTAHEDDEIFNLKKNGKTVKEIAVLLNRTICQVKHRIEKIGAANTQEVFHKFSPEEDKIIIESYAKDKKIKSLAKILGHRSKDQIKKRARQLGLTKRPAIWVEEEDELLSSLFLLNTPYKEIALFFPEKSIISIRVRVNNHLKLQRRKCPRSDIWTQTEIEQFIQYKRDGKTHEEISVILNKKLKTLGYFTTKFNAPSGKQTAWTEEECLKIIELANKKYSVEEISVVLQRPFGSTCHKFQKLGLQSSISASDLDEGFIDIPIELSIQRKFCNAKAWSKENNLLFDLDENFIKNLWENQQHKCFYSGQEMSLRRGRKMFSIDRKNSSLGYTKENVVLCCLIFNKMKLNHAHEDFIEYCRMIVNHANSTDPSTPSGSELPICPNLSTV